MVARETSIAEFLATTSIQAGSEQVSQLATYTEILASRAISVGLLGPNEGSRILERHLFEALALWPAIRARRGRWVDIGSGAGLPGVPLACLGLDITLVEVQARRAAFLRKVIAELGLPTQVVQARAEDLGRSALRESFDGATSRALATLPVALELCLPLIAVGGWFTYAATPTGEPGIRPGEASLLPPDEAPQAAETSDLAPAERPSHQGGGRGRAIEAAETARQASAETAEAAREEAGMATERSGASRTAAGEGPSAGAGAAAASAARQLGGGPPRWRELAVPGADGRRWVIIVEKVQPTPDRFPRRAGVPKRRPLG